MEEFSGVGLRCSDEDLTRPWQWKDHQEGVRFNFFRNSEDLLQSAGVMEQERLEAG